MSDTSMTDDDIVVSNPRRRGRQSQPVRGKIGAISLDPTRDAAKRAYAERAADPVKDPLGEHLDRFPGLYPEEIEQETRNVRIEMSFTDPIKIRDQAEMIQRAMEVVISKTREHHLGTIRQRIEARREADSLRRVLARFNGKTPHGDTAKKR